MHVSLMTIMRGLVTIALVTALFPAGPAAANIPPIQTVTPDPTFTGVVPRVGPSPWDGEPILAGTDGLAYTNPGFRVTVRPVSSTAYFVDEVWLVHPRVQYLFTNKDIPPPCSSGRTPCTEMPAGSTGDFAFGTAIDLGRFPQGTELIFAVKAGVGIDDRCADRASDGAQHHCYAVRPDPSFVPLSPDPFRVCVGTDLPCRNKAWPSFAPDGRSVFYTGPAARNVVSDSPHGRFQFIKTADRQLGFMGLEDVGKPSSTCFADKIAEGKTVGEANRDCEYHPDFQDAGLLIDPVLSATCEPTATAGVIAITGQPGFDTIELRDTFSGASLGTYAPGDMLRFTADAGAQTPAVTRTATTVDIRLKGSAVMILTDPGAPRVEGENPIEGGVCFAPEWPPVQRVPATLGGACALDAWTFALTGLATTSTPPPSVRVRWSTGSGTPEESAVVPLTSFTDGTARYVTTQHLGLALAGATVDISGAWSAFAQVSGPCPVTPSPSVVPSTPPSAPPSTPPSVPPSNGPSTPPSPTPVPVKRSTITDHECVSYEWHFVITQIGAAAPGTIWVSWGNATMDLAREKITGGTAHYRTTENLDRPVTAAYAVLPATWSGQFNVSHGPCFGPKTPRPTSTTTPPPSNTPRPSPAPKTPPAPASKTGTSSRSAGSRSRDDEDGTGTGGGTRTDDGTGSRDGTGTKDGAGDSTNDGTKTDTKDDTKTGTKDGTGSRTGGTAADDGDRPVSGSRPPRTEVPLLRAVKPHLGRDRRY